MEKLSLCRDLMRNPRDSEDSRIVASKWGNATDAYLPEIPDASNTQYFNLTAERLLYRDKLLSLPIDKSLAECEAIQSARPFGPSSPNFAMLRVSSVRLAMAFVPLTPTSGNGNAILARFYCVAGLPEKNKPPFAEGGNSPDINKYTWFVAGVPAVFEGEELSGRSWLLAANLLMRIVEKHDAKTARNLATSFIVTGDVANGVIAKVEMGNKPKLADIKEFSNRKWIIPMKNEMNNVSIRRIEKPGTLDEAYALIESMQNKATRSLFKQLSRDGQINSDDINDLLEMGADPTLVIQSELCNSLQIFDVTSFRRIEFIIKEINKELVAIHSALKAKGFSEAEYLRLIDPMCQKINELSAVRKAAYDDVGRTLAYYGGVAQMFFLLAKSGEGDLVKQLCRSFDIDASDSKGETALDFAERAKENSAKELLVKCGAKRRGRYEPYSDSIFSIICNPKGYFSDDNRNETNSFLHEALENGLNPDFEFCYGSVNGAGDYREATWSEWEDQLDEDGFPSCNGKKFDCRRRRQTTTLLLEALYAGNEGLMRDCFEHGANLGIKVLCAFNRLQSAKQTPAKDDPTGCESEIEQIDIEFIDASFQYKRVSIAELMEQDYKSFPNSAKLIYKEWMEGQKNQA